MSSFPDPSTLARALQILAPDLPQDHLLRLAEVLTGAQAPPDGALVRDNLGAALRALAGSTLTVGQRMIHFGEGNQFGDVTFRDIAGGDIVHLYLLHPEWAYDVTGLPNCYLGLQAFTYDERTRFAGRARLVAEAIRLLTTPGEQRTLLLVTGGSGSGKSSLAQAGVVPALERYYAARGRPFRHAVMRPSRQPLASLADAFVRLGIPTGDLASDSAPPSLDRLPGRPGPDIAALVLDQAEELFTQSDPAQRDRLLSWLGGLPPFQELGLHIICTIRSDFLGDLIAYQALEPAFREQLVVRAMDEAELREAIQRPVQDRRPDKRVEPALLDALTSDAAGDPAYLPLLQVTLEDLWRRGSMTRGAYSMLTDAIRERAEIVYHYQDYDGARQHPRTLAEMDAILALLLDLIEAGPDDDDRRDLRQRRGLAELIQGKPERERLVADLVTARLLSTSVEQRAEGEVRVVDIIHESLITNWARLREAIHVRREGLQRRARFEAAVRLWVSRGKPDDELLTGGRLAEARLLGEAEDVALNTPEARELLARSLAREEALRRRQLQQVRIFAAILGVLLTITTAAGILAGNRSREATRQAALAQTAQANVQSQLYRSETQRLAFAAQSELARDPTRALLLAAEAFARERTATTTATLLAALDGPARSRVTLDNSKTLSRAVFSPDGATIATSADDGTIGIWETQSGAKLADLTVDGGAFNSVAFSPDGQRIVAAADDGRAMVWIVERGERVLTLEGGQASTALDAVFSPDGRLIAIALSTGAAVIWDATTGASVRTLGGHSGFVRSVAFSPDGTHLATASGDGDVIVWDVGSGAQVRSIPAGLGLRVLSVVYSDDGKRILTASEDGMVNSWDALSGERRLNIWVAGPNNAPVMARFSPDGQSIVTATPDGIATIWDARSGERRTSLNSHAAAVLSASFSPDGQSVLTASRDGTAVVWDVVDGAKRTTIVASAPAIDITSAAYSPDGSRILAGTASGAVLLFDTRTGEQQGAFAGLTSLVTSVAFSPDGQHIAAGAGNGTMRIWNVADYAQRVTVPGGDEEAAITGVVYSPDGTRILSASADGTATIWDSRHGERWVTLRGHTGSVRQAAFTSDGGNVLTASEDGSVILWDARGGAQLGTLKIGGPDVAVESVAFSPDGTRFLTATATGVVTVWDTSSGAQQLVFTVKRPGRVSTFDTTYSARFSPDGLRIVTAGDAGSVVFWDARSGVRVAALNLDESYSSVSDALYSPDGRSLLVLGSQTMIWTMQSGIELNSYSARHPTLAIWSAAYSPDGRHIVASADSGTALVLDATSGDLLHTLSVGTASATVYTTVYSPDGHQILTTASDNQQRSFATIWDAASGRALATFELGDNVQTAAVYSSDSATIATAGNGAMKIWDAANGTLRKTLANEGVSGESVAYSPDGTRVAASLANGTALIWDVTTGAVIATLSVGNATSSFYSLAFSPDGQSIVSATVDDPGSGIVWETTSGKQRFRLSPALESPSAVRSAAYSPDGGRIITTHEDGTFIIWDANTGDEQATVSLGNTEEGIAQASFSPDGNRVLLLTWYGLRQYLIGGDQLLQAAGCRLWRDFTTEELVRFGLREPLAFSRSAYQCPAAAAVPGRTQA